MEDNTNQEDNHGEQPKVEATRRPTRERKQVERLTVDTKTVTKLEIKSGKGLKLGDIPNIAFKMSKFHRKDDFLKKVHSLMYRKPGQFLVIKKNILEFSGFSYDKPEAELEKDTMKLYTFKVEELNLLLDTLDLPRGKGEEALKEGKVARILQFLSEPKISSNKNLAEIEAKNKLKRKKAALSKKKKKSKIASNVSKRTKASKPKHMSLADDEDEDDNTSDDGEGEEEAQPELKAAVATPATGDTSEDDDVPLTSLKKAPKSVTPEELKKSIREILNVVDLSCFSLKDMRKKLSVEFGGADMDAHKSFIKEEVTAHLASIG